MLRACVLCCAVAGVVGLTVGCDRGVDPKVQAGFKAKLDELDKKAAALKEKADKAAAGDKEKLDAKVKDAAAKREAAVKKVDELKAAATDRWEAAKKDADAAVREYEKAVAE